MRITTFFLIHAIFLFILPSLIESRPPATNMTKKAEDLAVKETIKILKEDKELREKIRSSKTDESGKDGKINPNLQELSRKVLDRFDDIEKEKVDEQRRLQQQLRKAEQRQENPNVPFQGSDNEDPHEAIARIKERLGELAEGLRLVEDVKHEEYLRYQYERLHEEKEQIEEMVKEGKSQGGENNKDEKVDSNEEPKLHHPGSKAQLQDVWENSDGFSQGDFTPRSFFVTHDLNGDGQLDFKELDTIMQRESHKLAKRGRESVDEVKMNKITTEMRNHFVKEVDANKDALVSLDEFLQASKSKDFEHDEGWNPHNEEEYRRIDPEDFRRYEERIRDAVRFNDDDENHEFMRM